MTVRVYKSTDASAPTLTGQVGSLTALLDAVLVNGYGALTAAGWTIAFTGTNKRNYTMAAGGSGCSLYVDDTAPTTAKEARINGFATSTALGTGTGQFPTFSQSTIGTGMLVARKSATADGTARAWTIVADGHTFYMFVETGDETSPLMTFPFMFGDFFSYSNTDPANCIIIARQTENSALGGSGSNVVTEVFNLTMWGDSSPFSGVLPGHYVAGQFNSIGSSINCSKIIDQTKAGIGSTASFWKWGAIGYAGTAGSNSTSGAPANGGTSVNQFPYPSPLDSGLYVSPIWIVHGGLLRGYLKGLWAPLQQTPLTHNDTYSGTGNLTGKSLLAQSILAGSWSGNAYNKSPGQVHVETSDTWA